MAKNNEELEDKLLEELEDDEYEENSGNKRLLLIGGIIAGILVVVAIVLSLFASSKNSSTETAEKSKEQNAASQQKEESSSPTIAYDQDYSRNPDSDLAKKVGEPTKAYPPKTSGARVPVDGSGKSIEGVPIQKSMMIDDRTNPLHALHTVAQDVYDLMEINFYTAQNKSLTLGELIDRARIQMPGELFNRLDNFYRIFMYRGSEEKGPGTAVVFSTSMNSDELDTIMKGWEKTMVDNLRTFVLIGLKKDFVGASNQKDFQSSSLYPKGRFVDFSGEGIVSLNYLVLDKYIIFANSRSTFEKTIELLNKK